VRVVVNLEVEGLAPGFEINTWNQSFERALQNQRCKNLQLNAEALNAVFFS
jgi:hypothetical protein